VAIVTTTSADGHLVGLTCNSFSSVSLDPPLISWGLRLSSRSLEAFRQADAFALNILAEDQNLLSSRFASSDISDKFEGVALSRGLRGVPLIDDCEAWFECNKFAEHVAGDHMLLLGQVVNFSHGRAEDSLVFYKGAYMMLTRSLRELADRGRIDPANLDQARRLVNGMVLRLACENGTEVDFDAIDANIREIEGCTAPGDRDRRSEASLEFFRLITKAAHNDVLEVVSDSLTTILRHVLKAEPAGIVRTDLVPVRRQILADLRARDGEAAMRAMDRYIAELRSGA
jgi:flavin reductase (DIM6/NTAB) family NADH-FMN oxidoreductase RutF